MAIGPESEIPSTTEDVPATPGWVEDSVERAFARLPAEPAVRSLRNAYLDCLAGTRGPDDVDAGHDRCRRGLVQALREQLHLGEQLVVALEQDLEAIEAELTDRT